MYNPQLDTFIKVAEAGSFSKAAAALFITPTAVIKQMNILESRLGVTLFNRSHQGLSLTNAGESLLADAKHIVQYSQESIARAKSAERAEKRVVRVGVSLVTPATRLAELWPRIRELCPGMSMQAWTFENTPEAPRTLADLGRDVDVVLGVYDSASLHTWGCTALELSREPLFCAVPVGSDLAKRDVITLDDLRCRSLMMIRRGWNDQVDLLREQVRTEYPDIMLDDIDQYRADAFNRCVNEEKAMVSLELWRDVQPALATLPTDWGFSVSYGVLHSPEPSEHVAEFLSALQTIVDEEAAA